MSVWAELKERGARVVEKRKLSDTDREEWTAAVLMLRSFWFTPDGKNVARKELRADKPWYWTKVRDGIGPVYLAREAFNNGWINQRQLDAWTWDTVLWTRGYDRTTGKPLLEKIGNDFGNWKDAVADQLAAYDIADPRSDNRKRLAAWAFLIAGAAGAIAITVLTAGVAAPAAVSAIGGWSALASGTLAAGTAGSKILYSSSDESEAAYNQAASTVAGVQLAYEGSDRGQAAAEAIGTGVGSFIAGDDPYAAADKGLRAYADTRAAQTAPPAPPAVASYGETVVSWAKTPGGMITIGALAVVLVVLAHRK